ncbi:MAG: hypothetical protein M1840_007926 [Geoglossum simile]|nr:MAG: hypothetical protein M1840_007926 [Geoglossum simile]
MKGGNAAPRGATARPAWEDIGHHPDSRDGTTVTRKIGRWAILSNTGSSAMTVYFHRNTPHGNLNTDNPYRYRQTFEHKNWKVHVDKFPWLDLTNKRTISNRPFERQIVKHIASTMMSGYSTDDCYRRYLTEDEKECPLYKQALLAYEYETAQGEPWTKRKWYSTKEIDTAAEPPRKKLLLPKRPDPAGKMPRKKWLEYQASLAETETLLSSVASCCYDRVPEDHIYIARDCKNRVILAVFPKGLKFAYGPEAGQRCNLHWDIVSECFEGNL